MISVIGLVYSIQYRPKIDLLRSS